MKRRSFLRTLAGGASAILLGPEHQAKDALPNLLYMFSDMQRASAMSCYGNRDVKTPILDKMAKEGALFTAAMSSTPVSCPHRASLHSGLYCHNHGVVSNKVRFLHKNKCIAETFQDAGYKTAYIGKWHVPEVQPEDLGFSRVLKVGGKGKVSLAHHVLVDGKKVYSPTEIADQTIEFIKKKKGSKNPWLIFISWIPPHGPYRAPKEYADHYRGQLKLRANVPNGEPKMRARESLPDYYGMIESLDVEVGRILKALSKTGQSENTIVVYSSDHGDMVGSHGFKGKRWPYDESVRIPFILRFPGRVKPRTVIDAPIGTPDVYPTLTALAGLKYPKNLDGVDFSSFVTGKTGKPPP